MCRGTINQTIAMSNGRGRMRQMPTGVTQPGWQSWMVDHPQQYWPRRCWKLRVCHSHQIWPKWSGECTTTYSSFVDHPSGHKAFTDILHESCNPRVPFQSVFFLDLMVYVLYMLTKSSVLNKRRRRLNRVRNCRYLFAPCNPNLLSFFNLYARVRFRAAQINNKT